MSYEIVVMHRPVPGKRAWWKEEPMTITFMKTIAMLSNLLPWYPVRNQKEVIAKITAKDWPSDILKVGYVMPCGRVRVVIDRGKQ
jgi:hypothetical protein